MARNESRRAFLRAGGRLGFAFAGAALLRFPLPAAIGVEARKHPAMLVLSPNPVDLETPVELLDSWITPNNRFFIRSHLFTPKVDAGTWRLEIAGAVARPLSLTLEELKRLPKTSEVVTLECAGNGRALFSPRVAGAQWRRGAVGTARWGGVRLGELLERAGVKKAGLHAVFNGADQPVGNVPDFVRSVPIEKCWHPATLLAYEMNGAPLPVQHGFPLRLIVPGWEGAACVKWLAGITIQDHEYDGFFMKTAYRYPTAPVAPGASVDSAEMKPVTALAVKSLITSLRRPAPRKGGPVVVEGFAWAGENDVTKVECSIDGGKTWNTAGLGAETAPFAWRGFRYEWKEDRPAERVLVSRATDNAGRVQPGAPQWNPSGYLYNALDPLLLPAGGSFAAHKTAQPSTLLPAGTGRAIVGEKCAGCHNATLIAQQRLNRSQWTREVEKMMRWGAPVAESEKEALIDYLFSKFH